MTDAVAIRLVLDQGVPHDAANLLRERGCDCIHVSEIGMASATDEEIIARALEQSATIVTLDADFHAILAVSAATAPSVIRLRMQGLDASAVVEIVRKVLTKFSGDLRRGALVTVKAHKTTRHKLPIGGFD